METTEIVLLVLVILTLGLSGWLFYHLQKVRRQQWILTRGMDNANIEEIVTRYIQQVEELEKRLEELKKGQLAQGKTLLTAVQRVGLVRFNAFDDVGGKLSFAAALLDEKGNGVVFSTISGRTETRTYAKRVVGGQSEWALSGEEYQAIQQAMEGKQ